MHFAASSHKVGAKIQLFFDLSKSFQEIYDIYLAISKKNAIFATIINMVQKALNRKSGIGRMLWVALSFLVVSCVYGQDALLTGTVIGSTPSVDYSQEGYPASLTANTRDMAFDGSLDTYFASYERSYTWVGLDLGTPHVITRVGWSPRNDGLGPGRMVLGVFEGANQPDFMDALPLYMITQAGTIGVMDYAEVHVSLGFRYVRYIGPSDSRCNIAELAFYGHEGMGDLMQLYQLTNLPTISIHTRNNAIPQDKETDIESVITIITQDGQEVWSAGANIHLRGNASMEFPKKPYLIQFNKKQHIMDAPAVAKKWCLIPNYGDKTLMRNLIAYDFSRRFEHEYTPYSRPVDVLLNGEYQGCYQWADHLDNNPHRIPIETLTRQDNSGEPLTGGYHLEMDGYYYKEPKYFFSSRYHVPVTIKSPTADSITDQQFQYIQNYFNAMEEKMQSATFSDPQDGYRSMLDFDSFAKHFLIGELSGNTDTYWSMHMYKKRNNPLLYCGPEWDFDIAFDNDYRQAPVSNKSNWLYLSAGSNSDFVSRIIQHDPSSYALIRDLWTRTRAYKGLDPDTICDLIDYWAQQMEASQRLNFQRWPILNQYVHMNPQAAGSYQAEVQYLKNFILRRFTWMDNKLNYVAPPPLEPEGLEETTTALPYTKVLEDGQIIIIRNQHKYDILGHRLL